MDYTGYVIQNVDGTIHIGSEEIAYALYEKIEGEKKIFKVLENGDMILIK